MYGRIKLKAGEVETLIAERDPIFKRYGCLYGFEYTNNRYDGRQTAYGLSILLAGKCHGLQVLFVFNKQYEIEVYNLNKEIKNKASVGLIMAAVDKYMEREFIRPIYDKMLQLNKSKDWFWERLEYKKKLWVGEVEYSPAN